MTGALTIDQPTLTSVWWKTAGVVTGVMQSDADGVYFGAPGGWLISVDSGKTITFDTLAGGVIECKTGLLKVDNIGELTSNAGVTVDGVLCKDGVIPNSAYPNALLLDGSRFMTGPLYTPFLILTNTPPYIFFDITTGDWLMYDTTNDQYQFYIGASLAAYIDASGLSASGVKADTINELTSGIGVTIDGMLVKDSEPYCDYIHEKTYLAGVTVEGVLHKGGKIPTSSYPDAVLRDGSRTVTGTLTFVDANISLDPYAYASSGVPLLDSGRIAFRARYWNGAGSRDRVADIYHDMISTAPLSKLRFSIGSNWMNLRDTGELEIDEVIERSAGVGVTMDGVLCKDGSVGDATHQITNIWVDGVSYIDQLNVEEVLNLDGIDIAGSVAGDQDRVIPVTIAGTTYYIPAWTSYA